MSMNVLSKKYKYASPKCSIEFYEINTEFPISSGTYIGIDPGTVHLGIAQVNQFKSMAWEITLIRNPNPVIRILDMKDILQSVLYMNNSYIPTDATIEGASFADTYRQVELAEQRAATVIYLKEMFSSIQEIRIVAPNSIRKKVFGNGKTKAQDVWKDIPPNAACALACALYSAGL